jgi:hypothetical protein
MDWSEPQSFMEWLKRVFSLRPIMMALVIYCILISELRFDWMEQVLGNFLVTTNSRRPESGAIWEVSRKTATAKKALERILIDRQTSQREARDATSFTQMSSGITINSGAMLSSDHFRDLYLRLPRTLAREIIPPVRLLQLYSTGDWDRTYITKSLDGLDIYLLDKGNSVLQEVKIPSSMLYRIEREEMTLDGPLENHLKLKDRVYTVESFFKALGILPEEIQQNIIPDPDWVLNLPGRLLRVGISDEAISGFVEIGFEYEVRNGLKIKLMQAREWAVWRLHLYLDNETTLLVPENENLDNDTLP